MVFFGVFPFAPISISGVRTLFFELSNVYDARVLSAPCCAPLRFGLARQDARCRRLAEEKSIFDFVALSLLDYARTFLVQLS